MPKNFQHAVDGISWSFTNHRNFKVFTILSILVLIFAYIFHITKIELTVLVFTIMLGYVTEMLNTAIEEVTNLVTIKWANQAKIAKDVSAGMVLITAIGAVAIGFIIFIPYIVAIFW